MTATPTDDYAGLSQAVAPGVMTQPLIVQSARKTCQQPGSLRPPCVAGRPVTGMSRRPSEAGPESVDQLLAVELQGLTYMTH